MLRPNLGARALARLWPGRLAAPPRVRRLTASPLRSFRPRRCLRCPSAVPGSLVQRLARGGRAPGRSCPRPPPLSSRPSGGSFRRPRGWSQWHVSDVPRPPCPRLAARPTHDPAPSPRLSLPAGWLDAELGAEAAAYVVTPGGAVALKVEVSRAVDALIERGLLCGPGAQASSEDSGWGVSAEASDATLPVTARREGDSADGDGDGDAPRLTKSQRKNMKRAEKKRQKRGEWAFRYAASREPARPGRVRSHVAGTRVCPLSCRPPLFRLQTRAPRSAGSSR